jgi:hypothetical protein
MQSTLTKNERASLLRNRARRLQFFVETYNGNPHRLIEAEAYLVLEAHQSRRVAIWRYARYALKEWRHQTRFKIELSLLVFWFHRIKGLELGAAINQAHKVLEARILASMKGADHGRPH